MQPQPLSTVKKELSRLSRTHALHHFYNTRVRKATYTTMGKIIQCSGSPQYEQLQDNVNVYKAQSAVQDFTPPSTKHLIHLFFSQKKKKVMLHFKCENIFRQQNIIWSFQISIILSMSLVASLSCITHFQKCKIIRVIFIPLYLRGIKESGGGSTMISDYRNDILSISNQSYCSLI